MIRTSITVALLIVATLYLPLSVQIVLYLVAVFTIPHRLALFIPAVFSDVLYGPAGELTVRSIYMTLFVLVVLSAHFFLFTKTRFGNMFYGVEK